MRKTHANQHDCIQAARRKVPVPQWSKAQSLCKNAAINGCLHSLNAASSEMRVPSMQQQQQQQGGSSAAAPSLQPTRRLSGNDTNASVTSALGCERELMKRFSSSGMSHLSSNSPERPTRDCIATRQPRPSATDSISRFNFLPAAVENHAYRRLLYRDQLVRGQRVLPDTASQSQTESISAHRLNVNDVRSPSLTSVNA